MCNRNHPFWKRAQANRASSVTYGHTLPSFQIIQGLRNKGGANHREGCWMQVQQLAEERKGKHWGEARYCYLIWHGLTKERKGKEPKNGTRYSSWQQYRKDNWLWDQKHTLSKMRKRCKNRKEAWKSRLPKKSRWELKSNGSCISSGDIRTCKRPWGYSLDMKSVPKFLVSVKLQVCKWTLLYG